MHIHFRPQSFLVAATAVLTVSACSRPEPGTSDSLAAGSSVSAADTGMAGMDHSQMAGMDRGPAKDAKTNQMVSTEDVTCAVRASCRRRGLMVIGGHPRPVHRLRHQQVAYAEPARDDHRRKSSSRGIARSGRSR